MADPEFVRSGMSRTDSQIGAFFNIVGRVSRDPDPEGFGYFYDDSIAERVGEVSTRLQDEGLSRKGCLGRLLAASELSVVVREHIEPRLPIDNLSHRFN
jgi:hypothetical protein